jgi:ubiquinone/menaquinone biosynthesis C-methylase UbiE
MKIQNFKQNIADGFDRPTEAPVSLEQAEEWQKANQSWWENNPMRYDWKEKIPYPKFTKEYYLEIDKRFFNNAQEYLSYKETPFDNLINFNDLKNKDILEIGVGNGSHAQLLAKYAKTFIGIDLTQYATQSVSKRMEIFGLKANILQMDAEKLNFTNESFDVVWSWGVIHHSSNTPKIINEIHRVLRPGGKAYIMVYHRGWWNYYIMGFLWGIFSGNLFKTKSLHKTVQLHTDGAIARYYSVRDWNAGLKEIFKIKTTKIMGPKSDIVPLPFGYLKFKIMGLIPNWINRFLTGKFKMGGFIFSVVEK